MAPCTLPGRRTVDLMAALTRSALASACVGIALAGCGASSDPTVQKDAPSPTSLAPSPASPIAATDDCGPGAGVLSAVTAALTTYPGVKLDTSGGCGSLDISTALTKADVTTAQKICEAASTIAYAGAVKNVTVTGAANVELAISVKGQPCVGEP